MQADLISIDNRDRIIADLRAKYETTRGMLAEPFLVEGYQYDWEDFIDTTLGDVENIIQAVQRKRNAIMELRDRISNAEVNEKEELRMTLRGQERLFNNFKANIIRPRTERIKNVAAKRTDIVSDYIRDMWYILGSIYELTMATVRERRNAREEYQMKNWKEFVFQTIDNIRKEMTRSIHNSVKISSWESNTLANLDQESASLFNHILDPITNTSKGDYHKQRDLIELANTMTEGNDTRFPLHIT